MAFEVPTGRRMVFGGAVVAFAVTLAVVVLRVGVKSTPASLAYTQEPFYAIWGGLVLLQVVVWAIVGAGSTWWWRLIRDCTPHDVRPRHRLVGQWALTAVALLPDCSHPDWRCRSRTTGHTRMASIFASECSARSLR